MSAHDNRTLSALEIVCFRLDCSAAARCVSCLWPSLRLKQQIGDGKWVPLQKASRSHPLTIASIVLCTLTVILSIHAPCSHGHLSLWTAKSTEKTVTDKCEGCGNCESKRRSLIGPEAYPDGRRQLLEKLLSDPTGRWDMLGPVAWKHLQPLHQTGTDITS